VLKHEAKKLPVRPCCHEFLSTSDESNFSIYQEIVLKISVKETQENMLYGWILFPLLISADYCPAYNFILFLSVLNFFMD
jgi:hypothetical protein